MKFCEFCAPFYTGKKATTRDLVLTAQAAIADFFMSTALGEIAKIELIFGEDQSESGSLGSESLQMIYGERQQVPLMRHAFQEQCREN